MKIDEKKLFEAPKEADSKPQELVGRIEDPEEQKRLLEEAMEASQKKLEAIKENHETDEEGNVIVPLVTSAAPNNGSEKKYLLLFDGVFKEDDSEFRDWMVAEGRVSAYNYIKEYMTSDDIVLDLVTSLILVDVERFEEAKTMYDFMEYVIENDLIEGEDLYPHLEEYVKGDV